MRFFSVFVILSFASLVLANEKFDDGFAQKFKKIYQFSKPGCVASTGIDKTMVDAFESAEMIEDKRIYCYIGCLMKKMNIIDEKGQLTNWQVLDMYQVLLEDDWNKNAKILTKGLMNDLKYSKGICEAGRISFKLMQTIIRRA